MYDIPDYAIIGFLVTVLMFGAFVFSVCFLLLIDNFIERNKCNCGCAMSMYTGPHHGIRCPKFSKTYQMEN